MGLLLVWALLAIILSHVCSLLEVTLLSVRTSALLERQAAGSIGAAYLLDIKRNHIDDAIGAILILNTVAITLGATLGGARAAQLFGETGVGVFSATLAVFLLWVSEIVPKTLAARSAGRLAALTGHALSILIRVLSPALIVNRAIVRMLARRPRERLTRAEFAIVVGTAPQEGAISLAEARLIGNLIYSREIPLKDVMTPHSMVVMLSARQTVGDLIAAPGVDAFSRLPLFDGNRSRVTGYVSHREVLKAYALTHDAARRLDSFRRAMPTFAQDEPVARAFEQLLLKREAIALVVGAHGEAVGLATLEDMLEAILGMEITDEAEAIARLRPAVAESRKQRAEQLRRTRQQRGASNGAPADADGPRGSS